MPSTHAKYAPSARERWQNCTACVPFCEALMRAGTIPRDTESKYTLYGSALHERSEQHLDKDTDPADDTRDYVALNLAGAQVVFPNDPEGQEIVCTYVNYVRDQKAILELCYGVDAVWSDIEGAARLLGTEGLCWGTCDAAAGVIGEELHVMDLKTGAGHIVDPEYNPQLELYAAMIAMRHDFKYEHVFVHAVQPPRPGGIAEPWVTDCSYLREVCEQAKRAIAEAESGQGVFKAGDHCKWCPAKRRCKERDRQAAAVFGPDVDLELIDNKTPDIAAHLSPATQSSEKLAWVWRNLPAVKAFVKDYEQYIMEVAVENPGSIPGFKVVGKRSNRKLAAYAEVDKKLQERGLSQDTYTECKSLGIGKLEKLLGKGVLEDLELVQRPPDKPLLVPDDDPRPLLHASEVFGDVPKIL